MRAERERARAADGRTGGLYERRQVDSPERPSRGRGERARPALPHARPDHALVRDQRPQLPGHRHRRLHPQAAARARGRLLGDARGGARRRPDRASPMPVATEDNIRTRCWPQRVDGDMLQLRRPAPSAGTRLALNKVDLLDDERRRELSFRFPQSVRVSATDGAGLADLREAIEARFLTSFAPYGAARALRRRHQPLRAARRGQRARARGHGRGFAFARACRWRLRRASNASSRATARWRNPSRGQPSALWWLRKAPPCVQFWYSLWQRYAWSGFRRAALRLDRRRHSTATATASPTRSTTVRDVPARPRAAAPTLSAGRHQAEPQRQGEASLRGATLPEVSVGRASEDMRGRVTVTWRGLRLSKTFRARPDERVTVPYRLKRKQLSALREHRRLRLTVGVTARDPAGHRSSKTLKPTRP